MRKIFNFCGEVFFRVEDDLVRSCGASQRGFFFGGDGGEDSSATDLRHLDKKQPSTACSGVDEDLVAALDRVGRVRKIVGGHALKDGGGGQLEGNAVGDEDEATGGSDGKLGVGSGDEAPGDAITCFDCGDVSRDSDDDARGLLTQRVWELRGVAALAKVGVDEVDAGGLDADESFAGAGDWSE